MFSVTAATPFRDRSYSSSTTASASGATSTRASMPLKSWSIRYAPKTKSRRGDFGKSYQYSALMAVLNERIRRDGTRNMVIFQSDGDQNALMGSDMSVGKGSYGFDDVVESAERKGVTIYTVFTGANLGGLSRGEVFEQIKKVIQDETYASVVLSAKKNAPGPVK